MQLTELDPRWMTIPGRHGLGMSFYCPHCQNARIPIWFKNPIDGGPPITKEQAKIGEDQTLYLWARSGDTFEDITLSPSVDVSEWRHWHGFIRNGEIV